MKNFQFYKDPLFLLKSKFFNIDVDVDVDVDSFSLPSLRYPFDFEFTCWPCRD